VTDPDTFDNGLLRDVANDYDEYRNYWGYLPVRQ
jgi:hypothetical protein